MKSLKIIALCIIALFTYTGANAQFTESVEILNQPEHLIACDGSDGNFIGGVVQPSNNTDMVMYQWYKNGEMFGMVQTNPGIGFDPLMFSDAGLYYFETWLEDGSGTQTSEIVKSITISVQVITQPKLTSVSGGIFMMAGSETKVDGSDLDALMDAGGSISFIAAPGDDIYFAFETNNYIDEGDDRTSIQWWRVQGNNTPEIVLESDRVTGINTNLLKISNVTEDELNYMYYAQVIGLCDGILTAKVSTVMPAPMIEITAQPENAAGCEGSELIYTVAAISTNNGDNANIQYQWYMGGVALVDGSGIAGSNTNTLTLTAIVDQVDIYCSVMYGTDMNSKKDSDMATLIVGFKPSLVALDSDATVKVGESISFTIEATDADSFAWYRNSSTITVIGTEATLTLEDASVDMADGYYVIATNICGDTQSNVINLSVDDTRIAMSVLDEAKYELSNTPNPVSSTTEIKFTLDKTSFVTLMVTDNYGNNIAELNNSTLAATTHSFDFDVNQYNLSQGVYFYTVIVDGQMITRQMLVVK